MSSGGFVLPGTRCLSTMAAPEWTAIGVQRQPRLVGLLLQRERNQVTEGALVAMVSPDKTLSGGGIQGGKSFPIPRSRTNGVGKNVTQTVAADFSHQPAGTPRGFTFARINLTMSSRAVPAWKIAATPIFLGASISWLGIVPQTNTRTSPL